MKYHGRRGLEANAGSGSRLAIMALLWFEVWVGFQKKKKKNQRCVASCLAKYRMAKWRGGNDTC